MKQDLSPVLHNVRQAEKERKPRKGAKVPPLSKRGGGGEKLHQCFHFTSMGRATGTSASKRYVLHGIVRGVAFQCQLGGAALRYAVAWGPSAFYGILIKIFKTSESGDSFPQVLLFARQLRSVTQDAAQPSCSGSKPQCFGEKW